MVDYYNYKMSGSEEEFDSQNQTTMSKAELRKNNKPIMEKRRRARINQCLDELKSLILEAMKKDPTRHSKLEKADILEMTVKHLQTMQKQHLSTAVATDPAVLSKFRTGFSECATEVSRFVSHLENIDPVVKQRLLSHLNNCVSNLQQIAPFYSNYVPYMPERVYPEVKVGFQSDFQNGDENNNGSARIQIPNGVQLIPSRLPTGELALLVPQSAGLSANFPFFPMPESSGRGGQSSAFTTVNRSQSPVLSPSTSMSSCGEESHNSENPHACSPNSNTFKIPEQSSSLSKSFSSSPETQKPHVTSTNDHELALIVEPKLDTSTESSDYNSSFNASTILRQPLSVITDKTYNRATSTSNRNKRLKRHSSDGLLVISEKKMKINESANKIHTSKNNEGHGTPVEDLSLRPTSSAETADNHAHQDSSLNSSGSSTSSSNGDMWRPW